MTNQPIAILAQYHNRLWASSRFRAYWLEDAAPDLFKVYPPTVEEELTSHKVLVFQKRQSGRDHMLARLAKEKGIKVVYDLTDPLWWFDPQQVLAEPMIDIADAVVVSSKGLFAEVSLRKDKNVFLIPDRMAPDFHPTTAEHSDHNPVVLVWFGIAQNRAALAGWIPVLPYLAYHGLQFELRIIDEKSHEPIGLGGDTRQPFKTAYVPWTLESFHAQVSACDIALLPPYPGPWGALKSNNKSVTAWWCGLPVVDDWNLKRLHDLIADADLRKQEGQENREKAEKEYGIDKSVEQWREVLEALS
jgi:hypothetical protein